MARNRRTRLNAELAHQYGAKLDEAAPGRSSLTPETTEDVTDEVDAHDVEAEQPGLDEAPQPEPQAKRSIFELPRKQPTPQPLPDDE